jgi:hypothetical protein
VGEAGVVALLFEDRHCPAPERVQLADCVLEVEAIAGRDDPGEELGRGVARGCGPFGCLLGDRGRLPRLGCERLGEIDLEMDIEVERAREPERALEE